MGLRPEEEARRDQQWVQAWQSASELERHQYKRLDPASQLHVLCLVPAGQGSPTLGEAIRAVEQYRAERGQG